MRFVQYYHNSTGYSGPVHAIPACGSEGVLPLDGRLSLASCHARAREQARRLRAVQPGFIAYRIEAGTYRQSRPVSALVAL